MHLRGERPVSLSDSRRTLPPLQFIGVLATLRAFRDDDAAGRWIDLHKQSIPAELIAQ